uniref:NS7a protein n=1 Tax=Eidolon bat coronavirus TaxID=2717680 RepID=A0AB38ZDP1_9NIDO
MIFIFVLLFPLCSASQFWVSVNRVCTTTCVNSNIFCPDEGFVESDKFKICLPVIPFKFEDTGKWFSFSNKSDGAAIKLRVLSSCFRNRVLSGCVGLENKCRTGVVHQQHHGELTQRLCVNFLNPGSFVPGYRYFYTKDGFTGSKQFEAIEKPRYNDMAQLEPGQGKTAEDDYNYDEYWFLWETPKPGSGF